MSTQKPLVRLTNRYNMSYAPLPEQKTIQGHSVRAMYLLTAAADLDDFASHAMRLWGDAVDHKMYLTGGLGTQPRVCHRLSPDVDLD